MSITSILKVLIVLLCLSLIKDGWQYSSWSHVLITGSPILLLLFFEWRNYRAKWDAQKVETNFKRTLGIIGVVSGVYLLSQAYDSRSWELALLPIFSLVMGAYWAYRKRHPQQPTTNH